MQSPFQKKYIKSPSLKINPNTIQNEGTDNADTYLRPLEIQIMNRDSATLDFLPYQNKLYNNTNLTTYPGGLGQANIWMQGNIYNIDLPVDEPWRIGTTTSGINLVTKVGGSVDGIAVAQYDQYLLWAFMSEPTVGGDESTCTFAGFGFSKIPIATVSALSSGTRDSTSVLTLSSRGYSYVPGQTCIMRGASGSPQTEWNYCTVISVTSNTSVTVFLWRASSQYANTDLSGGGYLVALDSYFPWNGNTANSNGSSWQFKDNIYLKRYRLVGQLATYDFTSSIPRCDWWRRADETVAGYRIGHLAPSVTTGEVAQISRTTAGTTSTSKANGRFLPPWTSYYLRTADGQQQASAAAGNVVTSCEIIPGFSTTGYYDATLWNYYRNVKVLNTASSNALFSDPIYIHRMAGLRSIHSVVNTIGAGGSVTVNTLNSLLGEYDDGGLREYNWTINSVGDTV